MVKTSVYLSEDEVARLAALAHTEGTSQADVIRRAIRQYVPRTAGQRDFAVRGSGVGPGTSVADIDEQELLEGFGS
jgi:hypothetical protein